MRFPRFISWRAHCETLAAKDETIALLRETNANLTASLKAFDGLLESLKPKPRVLKPGQQERQAPTPIDYSRLDANDNQALVRAAVAEVGPGRHNIARVQQRVQHIRSQILASQAERLRKAGEPLQPPPPDAISEAIEQVIAEGEAMGRSA